VPETAANVVSAAKLNPRLAVLLGYTVERKRKP
jgi:hypothetical protein